MKRRLAGLFILIAATVSLTACAGTGSGGSRIARNDPRGGTDARGVLACIARAPLRERGRENPFRNDGTALAAGARLFDEHCAECHGARGTGTRRAPTLRTAVIQNATPGELAWFLRNGNLRAGMPSWSGLPEARRWQLVSYVKSLGD